MDKLNNENQTISLRNALWIFAAVVTLWLITPVVMLFVGDLSARGQAGDLYGSINSLFSGLAFAGVVIAILLQRHELALQRQELALTRAELQRSAKAQNESQKALNKTIHAQAFKMAVEIVEMEPAISARRIVATKMATVRDAPDKWSDEIISSAEVVGRTFETVGTLIRRGALPAEYIVETWSVPIVRNWEILEFFIRRRRKEREDPYTGVDFEFLTGLARQFLADQKTKVGVG